MGKHTFTAANGDLVYATSANAVGVMQVAGTSDLAAARQKSSFSYDGWIAY